MPIEIGKGGIVCTGADGVGLFRMLALLHGAKLEGLGLRRSRGPSCLTMIKREYGLKGNREKVLEAFGRIVAEASAKVPRIGKG